MWRFVWQEEQFVIDIHCDSNWAGCHTSRKSTSGGTASLGVHFIKTWPKTQSIVAKSSGEAELYGVIRGSTEGLGMSSLLKDFGVEDIQVRLHVDASAAIGMVERRGLSKARHIDVDILWIQGQQARRLMPLRKIAGTKNVSDMTTNNVPHATMATYLRMMKMEHRAGRANVAQALRTFQESTAKDAGGETGGKKRKRAGASIKKSDNWEDGRYAGKPKLTRRHRVPRRNLFTPFGVQGSPTQTTRLAPVRVS